MNKLTLYILLVLLLASCATKKQILYFQDATNLDQNNREFFFEPIIENNDVLHISVSSLDNEVIQPFKRNGQEGGMQNNQNLLLQGYLVNAEGNIQFPVLGAVQVTGKTRNQVEQFLTKELKNFITDVVVDVRIMNFKVTVIGDVNSPGVFRIQDERITLVEAIALAGDLTRDGKRKDITIIREEDGKQKVAKIDITDTQFINSPFYFLKQNDVVYIEPSLRGVKKSGFVPDIPALLSLFTVVLSTVIILTR